MCVVIAPLTLQFIYFETFHLDFFFRQVLKPLTQDGSGLAIFLLRPMSAGIVGVCHHAQLQRVPRYD